MALLFRKGLKDRVKQSLYFGIMVDETTDTSINQQLIIYIKFLDRNQSDGRWEAVVDYLDLTSPHCRCHYSISNLKEGLTKQNSIHAVLKVFELDVRKLVGFGSDGCSTMMGEKSGVAVRLRRSGSPSMVPFHCPAHRLQLGILDVAGKVSSSKHGADIRIYLSWKLNKYSRTPTISIRILPNEGDNSPRL